MFLDEAVDGGLEVDDGVEDAVFQAAARQLGEEAFDGVEPGAGCRNEVKGPSPMPGQPGADLGLFVGGVIVEDDVDGLVGRELDSGHLNSTPTDHHLSPGLPRTDWDRSRPSTDRSDPTPSGIPAIDEPIARDRDSAIGRS